MPRTRRPDPTAAHVHLLLAIFASALGAVSASAQVPVPATVEQEVHSLMQNLLETARINGELWAAGEPIRALQALPEFFDARDHHPAWTDGGRVTAHVDQLLAALDRAPSHGLDPDHYHRDAIERLLAGVRGDRGDAMSVASLELLLTDAFLVYGSHLLHGRVNPTSLEPEWLANRRSTDMAEVLGRALVTRDVAPALDTLRPPDPRYDRLRDALTRYRTIAGEGGWRPVPGEGKLEEGMRSPRVPALRARLEVGGDLDPDGAETADPELFDASLSDAVRRFQRRHGLADDGVVGPATLEALNVPVEARVRQIEVNLERFRWLPQELGRRHVEVNIAGFTADAMEDGESVLSMRAIVGRDYRQTPSFSGRLSYLVFSPYWHVPPGIAARDKLPELRRNPGYLAEQRMTLLDAATNTRVDPASVDWASVTGTEFNRRYRLRQDPGPLNALGRVKFMFPNPYSVYLHDTPSRDLFARAERTFSSGCIRVEKPAELAAWLLKDDPTWTRERIAAAMDRTQEQSVHLPSPVPVHLLYWSAWAERDGAVHFRRDVYDRDRRVAAALAETPEEL